MSTREAEIAAMRRAVAISALGLGSTSPNPPVGCVILDPDGTPAGEGYQRRKGEPHAEVLGDGAHAETQGHAQGSCLVDADLLSAPVALAAKAAAHPPPAVHVGKAFAGRGRPPFRRGNRDHSRN